MSRSKLNIVITVDSPYTDIVAYEAGRFAQLTKDDVELCRKNFKKFDLNGNGLLSAAEIARVFESRGETKTITEVRGLINQVDMDKDGKISFCEFLQILAGPAPVQEKSTNEAKSQESLSAKANASKAQFFEQAAASLKDKTDDNKAAIQKEYEEKKRAAALKQAAAEAEKSAKEEQIKNMAASRERLAEKRAAFEAK